MSNKKSHTETKTTLEKVGITFKSTKSAKSGGKTVTKELINSFAAQALINKSDSLTNPDEFLNKFAADFEFAATTYRDLILTGQETIKDLIEIANESGNARAFEVVGQLIKTVGEVNEKMINSYKTTKEIVSKTAKTDPAGNAASSTAVAVEGNAIFFTGTTADLIKQLDAEIPGLSEKPALPAAKTIDV